MFSWFKKKPSKDAIAILDGLDKAIQSIHPDRFFEDLDAAVQCQPYLVSLNRMMGTPEIYRFRAVGYDDWVSAVRKLLKIDMYNRFAQSSLGDMLLMSMLAAGKYEVDLGEAADDATNLRREVRETAKSLLMFLNKHSTDKPQ